MQNLANELPALDAELTQRVAQGFVESIEIIAAHFRGCAFSSTRASSTAAALVAALEGARTVARLERTPAIFRALAEVSVQGWAASGFRRRVVAPPFARQEAIISRTPLMQPRNIQTLALAGTLSLALFSAPAAFAQMGDMAMQDPMVGGAAMYPSKTIVENAINSRTTPPWSPREGRGPGGHPLRSRPLHRLRPHQRSLRQAPAGTVDTLVAPENKAMLTKILTYHVVAGRYTAKDLMKFAKTGGTLTTVQGEPLTVSVKGHHVILTDAKGGMSMVTIADVYQSNGVIHVVDTVLMPN